MSEFDAYLQKLRAALDVSPTRAAEILAEARTHLEAKAAGLGAGGLGREEAAREAVASFGEPGEMAGRLTRANGRHRLNGLFRPMLAFGLAFVGMILAFCLLGGQSPFFRFLYVLRPALPSFAWLLAREAMMVALMGPVAVLAGLVAGRRWWWLAGTPMALWGGFVVVVADPRDQIALGAVMVCVLAPLAALWGRLGWKLSERHEAARRVAAACMAYMALAGAHALFLEAHDAVGFLAAAAVVLLVTGLLGTVWLWERGGMERLPAVIATFASGLSLQAAIGISIFSGDAGVSAFAWGCLAALEFVMMVVVAVTWRRAQRVRLEVSDV